MTKSDFLLKWQGLSFLALILLAGRLHEVDREVNFLQLVLGNWLPNDTVISSRNRGPSQTGQGNNAKSSTSQLTLIQKQHFNHLKNDIKHFIMELSSARTTLVLSVVFVVIYIFSWWWMAFAIKQGNVSLRTVLLLSVFAAVDIAASAGFILLRIIMYIKRDRLYPNDMRSPTAILEHDQLAAYAALRLVTLQSSCASTDVLVTIVVGFLTVLRVYSVVCVVSYYKKAKGGDRDLFQKEVTGGSEGTERTGSESIKDMDEYIPRPLLIDYNSKKHHTYSGHRGPRSNTSATASTDGDTLRDLKIQASDMSVEMQKAAVASATQAIKLYTAEKHIAESIKQDFDQLYHPTWHCIVGRNWGSCVTHSKQCYVRLAYKDMTIMLYRST